MRDSTASWARRLRKSLQGDGLRAQLLRGGMGSVILKAASMFLGFVVSAVLARSLGADGYGVYSFVFALTMLLVIPTRFGLTSLVLRETAKADAGSDWGLLRGLWRWADMNVMLISIVTIAVGGTGIMLASGRFQNNMRDTAIWGLALIPVLALLNVRGASLQGLRQIILGQMPETIVRPMLLVTGFAATMVVAPDATQHPSTAMAVHVGAAMLALALVSWMRMVKKPIALSRKPAPKYEVRQWRRSAVPLAFAEGTRILHMQIGILLLGVFRAPEELGLYQVAMQLGLLVSFLLSPLGLVASPHIARFKHSGEYVALGKLIRRVAVLSASGSAFIATTFLLFGRELLALVYGPEYVSAYPVLAIFCVNHLIFSSLGPQGVFLNMLGLERVNLRAAIWGTAVNALLCLLLIPEYGPVGAALGFLCASILVTAYSAWRLNRETGFLGS